MSRYQREKGKRAEVEVATLLRPLYPAVRSKRAGGESATVDRGRDLLGTPGLCVQVKGHARPYPLRALEEACRVAGEDEIPVAIVREIRRGRSSEWSATLPLTCFLALVATARLALHSSAADAPPANSKEPLSCDMPSQDSPSLPPSP